MPPTATAQKRSSTLKVSKNAAANEAHDDLEDWKKSRQLQKPKDQVPLTDSELKETVSKVLTTFNMQVPENLVQFDYGTNAFVTIPPQRDMVVLFERHGTYIHYDTDEARKQIADEGLEISQFEGSTVSSELDIKEVIAEEEEQPELPADEAVEEEGKGEEDAEKEKEEEEKPEEEEAEGHEAEGEGEETEHVEHAAAGGKPKKLTNQFNFSERAAQTYNNPVRCHETQTTPPPMATFAANVLQWVIYDEYDRDYNAQMLEKEREREAKERDKAPISKIPIGTKKAGGSVSDVVKARAFECWKVLERMINQNTYDDIAKDYRYWDDPSDEFRDEEGTLLPLWKFVFDKTKKHTVTDIFWNPVYYDLFTVCFGFLDFMKPLAEGAVCLFTLKNPSYPEHICMTDSCAMTADVHINFPYMVVVGLYDGNVVVFNVQSSCKKPAFQSNSVTNKHNGIVWDVKWAPDLPDGELNFFSVASDGKINCWVLMQNELAVTTIITLYLEKDPVPGPDGTFVRAKGCASCVRFHPKHDHIYLVGTEEGLIYKCSTEYSSSYLMTYAAHHMPIYRIYFNTFNPDIFISCSADWRVKIWEDNRPEPLFVFDIGAAVGDVKWAPYSSTVFAAVTTEGKVYVFDLNINKYKPICVQAVVSKKKNKLTRISFNHKLPIIIVGDDKGCVSTLKLSPNLRIPCKAPKKQQNLDQWTLQCMKLDKLLSLVREPPTLTIPPDTSGLSEDD